MEGEGRRRAGYLRLLLGACVATLVLTLVGVAPALAAPKTLHGSAYGIMKSYMSQFDKDGFAPATDLGAAKLYRVRLAQCKIVIDPGLRDKEGKRLNARYGPEPNVLTLSKDPRKLPAGAQMAWGGTVWHEVTHAIEDQRGDDQTNADRLFQERNIEYMASVANEALPWLEQLEKKAKAGASVAELAEIWKTYLEKMDYAATKLEETKKYPPDLDLMKNWFGFSVNAEDIKDAYLTDKAFSGDAWKNLRAALAEPDWSGEWYSYTFTPVIFTQTGDQVVGGSSQWDVHWSGTASGNVLTGAGEYSYASDGGEQKNRYSFSITMADDGQTWSGTLTLLPGGTPDRWVGWRPGHAPLRPPGDG
jgi:hypothetical protein